MVGRIKILASNGRIEKQNFKPKVNDDLSSSFFYIFDSDFENCTILDTVFDGSSLNRCNLNDARVVRCSFRNTTITASQVVAGAEFVDCDFSDAIVNVIEFNFCTFINCKFTNTLLEFTYFTTCDFIGCNFYDAKLPQFFKPNAMEDCANVPYIPMACPDEGEFIGYKIASDRKFAAGLNVLVTLRIPYDARRSSGGGRKCRCDKAEVISIEYVGDRKGSPEVAYSKYDGIFEYRPGETVHVLNFNTNRWRECAAGIHFFMNKNEALKFYGLALQ